MLAPTDPAGLRARIDAATRAGEVVPAGAADDRYRRELGEIKRLLERWRADPRFRERLREDPRAAARSLGLAVDPVGLEPLWDPAAAARTPVERLPLALVRFEAFARELAAPLRRLRGDEPTADPRLVAWRRRQRRRVETELAPAAARRMPHVPYAIELSEGCSVGCWFCGVSAPRLEQVFRYTAENAALFGAAIDVLVEVCGELAAHGMCYWATDPLDNPDYERFLVDCRRRTGALPSTSTALALRDVARTRALLELAREHGGTSDRFSVLSLAQLDRIHAEFSPEALLRVELSLQNRGSVEPKANVGRARLRRPGDVVGDAAGDRTVEDTSACVSGFLISMVRRTVRLIGPCLPTERRPLGYVVFAEGSFADAAGLRAVVREMVDAHMRLEPRGDERPVFHEHLAFEALEGGFRLVGRHAERRFTGDPLLARLGRAVAAGATTVDRLLDLSPDDDDTDPAAVLHLIELLRDAGVLDLRPPVT